MATYAAGVHWTERVAHLLEKLADAAAHYDGSARDDAVVWHRKMRDPHYRGTRERYVEVPMLTAADLREARRLFEELRRM
jgi:hypothetical protein